MNSCIQNWQKNKKILEKNHVYKELDEHASCGVGLIASLDGSCRREIVEMGVQALKVLYHSCLLYTSPRPRDGLLSRMPSSA